VRVAYLGQNCDSHTFVENVMLLRPACVLLSASLASQVEELGEIGRRLRSIPQPRPLFCFGGQAFVTAPELAEAIAGEYLGGDARDAVEEIKQKLLA
jgi:MerR family transcriptional regulator, light-induced transcriptional regulator